MPQYEYHCRECGNIFSLFTTVQEHVARPVPSCPRCQSKNVAQVFSNVSVMTSKKS